LNDEVKQVQENLRLSAGQMGKLQNEFKIVCNENEELRKKVSEYENVTKKINFESENKVKILTQECERLNSIV
jgi:hypothetical protein